MDLYANDDYRVKGNVTLNFGLRWEYFSPYVEKYNRLTNLSTNADFTQISQVCATAAAGCAVGSPRSLVNPDRTMFSPRIGVAWAAEVEVYEADGGAGWIRHQLQHGAVCVVCGFAGVPAAVCGDADEYGEHADELRRAACSDR